MQLVVVNVWTYMLVYVKSRDATWLRVLSFSVKILIASIMCSYNKNDWMELSKMAEVKTSSVYIYFIHRSHFY